ncbi:MAG TPA: Ig-like domain-containing protein [Candidatus Limnocylindria bacterium]|nr:Ig-like domain-containing protein [Candidatus Limnocylindria bacterium]
MFSTWFSEHRPRASRAWVAVASGLVVLAMLAASTAPFVFPAPSASPSLAGRPSGSPAAAGDWTALELPPHQPIAELIPEATAGGRISVDGALTLRSLTSAPAAELAGRLRVDPPIDLAVAPGSSADAVSVRPREPLAPNASYRFQLATPDGALAEEWSFRTGGPLHVVAMLPDDRSTQVPVDTGIEIEFDQDGVVDVASHVSIEPAVAGRFEQHGRTWAFVPSADLEPATLYTVTVRPGVAIEGTEHVLETEARSAFETAAQESTDDASTVVFERSIAEALPDEAPVIAVDVRGPVEQGAARDYPVTVHQLTTLDAAMAAAETLSVDRRWATWSSTGNVDTAGLDQVAAFDATVTTDELGSRLALPTGLAAGWYLLSVAQPGRDAQLLLQVTDLGVYALASRTSTVAWVNDLTREAPVRGAEITLVDGPALGATDADGLLEAATPDGLEALGGSAAGARLLLVTASDGRRVIAPLSADWAWYAGDDPSSRWWLMLATDRLAYRHNDTIHAWGLVRSRADRSVPEQVELRLVAGLDTQGPPLARVSVTPTQRGVVVGDLPIRDLPAGQYAVALFAGGEAVATAAISVTDIRKPTFRIGVETDRHAYIHGDRIEAAAEATFYDGTAAPGMDLRLYASGVSTEEERVVTAGSDGRATHAYEAVAPDGYLASGHLAATPAAPEQGSSEGSTRFVVFPSSVWLAAEAELGSRSLEISGRLSRVDLVEAETQVQVNGWVDDAAGPGISGEVTVAVDRVTWNPVRTGTTYDFLLKRTVPQFRYDRVVERIGTFRPRAGADGRFAVSVPVQDVETGSFEVALTAADAEGRVVRQSAYAATSLDVPTSVSYPYLEDRLYCGSGVTREAALDQQLSLTVYDGDGSPSDGRTLFVVGRLGIDQAVVTSESSLERRFRDGDLPSLTVRAIRFTAAGYVVTNDVLVRPEPGAREIDVTLEPDEERYAPGDSAAVTIRTTGPDGRPISADVVVQAVDMKLFAIGAAGEVDTSGLMAPASAGFLGSYASHRVPTPRFGDGCGATTGGGDAEIRDDFADVATFQLVSTDADGRGTASFELPDDLTSWGVAAAAFAAGLESGTEAIEMPVGLPFFVDATLASEYLAGEDAVVRLLAHGDALSVGDAIRFTVSAPSLDMAEATVEGTAFEAATVALPTLTLGDHRLTISAERVGAGPTLRDGIARTIRVVPTRLRTLHTDYDLLTDELALPGGGGLTTYVVTDAGRGALLRPLQELAANPSARFDTILAADLARELLIEEFDADEASLPGSGLEGLPLPSEDGIALLPYAAPDLLLTAKSAMVAGDQLRPDALSAALRTWADAPETARDRRIIALAGLASLGHDVTTELAAFEPDDLTVRERVWLALGLLAAGDEPTARAIERAVLTAHGQRLGPWVRLDAGAETPETAETTASMLLLAARLRDPIATDISRYLLDNPSTEAVSVLEQIGYIQSAIQWLPRPAARIAWTVDGERHEETIEPGGSFTVVVSAAQRRSLELERLEGDLAVASSWAGEARYDDLPDDPLVSIERTVTPAAEARANQLVRVVLNVQVETGAPRGCFQVTDLLPSGLAPVVATAYGFALEDEPTVIAPYEVEGQRVSWCVDPSRQTAQLGYWARVVSSGTYRWEPAVVQSVAAPAVGSATAPVPYRIR